MSTSDVYADVNARVVAGGDKCECGCGRSLALWGRVMDHWLGGSGRRKQMESAETCWMLTLKCNAGRTHNEPSAAHWNDAFRWHCAKHGFRFVPHVEHQPVRRRAR